MTTSPETGIASTMVGWTLVVHLGMAVTFLAVQVMLWWQSHREVILTWVVAWVANVVALLALVADVYLGSDAGWMSLYGGAKLVFALLLLRGIMMFKRDRLAMIQLSRNWAIGASLIFWFLLAGQTSTEDRIWTLLVVGIVLTIGGLFTAARITSGDGRLMILATIVCGLLSIHHGWRILFTGAIPGDRMFIATLGIYDVFSEFLIGLTCVLATGQRALYEVKQANDALLATQSTLRSLVDSDPLTGLLNRRRLASVLEATRDTGGSLVSLDVDDFKLVNDRWGHPVGDRALRRIADAMREVFRAEDGLFRIGGDEFLVVAPTMQPQKILERVQDLRVRLKPTGEDVVPISIAAGVIELHPDLSAEEALALADAAMYSDKAKTKRVR